MHDRHPPAARRALAAAHPPATHARREVAEIEPVDEVAIVVGMVTPSGTHAARVGTESVAIEMAGDYVLAALRDLPLLEEGTHRFQIRLRGQPVVSVEIPVIAVDEAAPARLH